MFKSLNTLCAVLASFALVSCSTYRDVRDWWTQDTGPTEEEWAAFRAQYAHENDPPPPAGAERREASPRDSQPKAIQESRLAPSAPRSLNARPLTARPPVARREVAPPRMANASPPARIIPPATPPDAVPQATPEAPSTAETMAAVEVPILTPKLSSVTGMSEANLRQALGAPSSATETGAQKIWRYTGNGCSVEILFFRDVTRNTYAALDHRTLARDGRPSSRPCMRYAPASDQSG